MLMSGHFLLTEGGIIEMGPLQLIIHIKTAMLETVKRTGTRQTKSSHQFEMVISFVFLGLVSLMLSSMAVFLPRE